MSKTPVSTLQEFAAKKGLTCPEYNIISETGGHEASFTYRVKCLGKTAEGTASSKKEAKHNAAKEMLKLLDGREGKSPAKLSLSPQKICSVDSYYLPGASKDTANNIFVNSVGKLGEHCAMHKLKTPEYTVSDIGGPDHLRTFTITCSIGSLSAKATANTKKQAKHDAAQNMYQRLMTSATAKTYHDLHANEKLQKNLESAADTFNNVEFVDIKMEELSISHEESRRRAQEFFPKLRCRESVKIVKNVGPEDYHEALKNSVSAHMRRTIKEKLDTETVYEKLNVKSNEYILSQILTALDLCLHSEIIGKQNGQCVVRCVLDSTPVISEIGVGKTVEEARENACSTMLKTTDLLLK